MAGPARPELRPRGAERIEPTAAPEATGLPLGHALALGALQGPTELLPVSSSGHLILLAELLDSPYLRLEPEVRKAFEVALHAGTAAALLLTLRGEVREVLAELDGRRALSALLAFAPPAAAGLALERAIEERAGGPTQVAIAQIAAGVALALADRGPATRSYRAAGLRDHLWLGVAQAAALVPGVSRNGATLTAARARRLDRAASSRLSRHAALPVIAGAVVLKGVRLARRGTPPGLAAVLGTGAGAAFASTFLARGLLVRTERARSLRPVAAYRIALGAAALTSRGAFRGAARATG